MSKISFGIENNENLICPHNKLRSVVYNDEPIRLNEISHLKKLGEETTTQPVCKECRHSVCTCIWTKMNQSQRNCSEPKSRIKSKHISRYMQTGRHLTVEDAFLNKIREKPKIYHDISRHSLVNSQSVHWILRPCRMRSSNVNVNSQLKCCSNSNSKPNNKHSMIDQQECTKNLTYKRHDVERKSNNPKFKKSFVYLVQDPGKGSGTKIKHKHNIKSNYTHQNLHGLSNSNTLILNNENIDIYTKNTKNFFNEKKRKLLGIVKNKYYQPSNGCASSMPKGENDRKSRSRSSFRSWLDNLIDKAKGFRDESCNSKTKTIRRKNVCKCPEMPMDEKKYELFLQNIETDFRCPPQMNRVVVKDQHVDANTELLISASTTAQASGSAHRLKDFTSFKGSLQNKPRFQIQTLKVSQVENALIDDNLKGLSTYEVELALSKIDDEKVTQQKHSSKKTTKKRSNKNKNAKKSKRNKLKAQKANVPIKVTVDSPINNKQATDVSPPPPQQIELPSHHSMPIQEVHNTPQTIEENCMDICQSKDNAIPSMTSKLTNSSKTPIQGNMSVIRDSSMISNLCEEPITIKRLPVIKESSMIANLCELQRIKEKLQRHIDMEQALRDADAEAVCNLVNSSTNPMSSKLNTSSTITEQDMEQHVRTDNFLEAPIRKCIKEFSATILKKKLKSIIKEKECRMDTAHIRSEICNLIPKTNLSIATLRNKDYTISFHAPVSMRYRKS